MKVTVHYFAVLREQRGVDSELLEVADDETAGGLYARLFPATAAGRLPVMYAVNQEYVQAGRALSEGDEVAFIPPLGGG